MVVTFSLACRSRKNFLLRSVFFLHAKEQLCQTEAQILEPNNHKDTIEDAHAHTRAHSVAIKMLIPLRHEIHQFGHIVTDAGFQYGTVFISLSMKGQKKETQLNSAFV